MITPQSTCHAELSPLLEVKEVGVRYNNGHTALYDVSFALYGGTTCALVGVNGSGKSTLFKSLMGLVKPLQGTITLHGLPVKKALKQNLVAYVPQAEEVDWQFPISVYDVVMTGRYGYMNFLRIASPQDKQKVEQAMARVDITHLKDRQIGELSGGQKKRVFLARALAQESRIILLDEPFTGVDVKTENAIVALLGQLRSEGHLILVSTHNLGSVPHFCDQVVMINRTVIAAGTTETTFTQKNLKLAFGGVLRYLTLDGEELHDDQDNRTLTVLTDDERPVIFYGEKGSELPPTAPQAQLQSQEQTQEQSQDQISIQNKAEH
ncbi:ATP-binding cassette domain-containing protein [Testudinibacter sp. TR-2022]|uniref:ATP-binding cassette domain-containing protein n=1 Tax=Testudinibacter sp. TR-2022 TaxID=2585029 RepID=UPI001119F35A|nr:ATP-binding cassette domain-containing protein [Testudinibacter sp. TR-2022]TNH06350.1 ATP-binding cassette domain-containing protein [Pasteurellaceae bacterium Phil11]TNH22231.1 ATP-binding cassette domain-containing protein [Testudinibacter sp. TR-2022]TNH25830.1 ATP-binding cassette domain-containing protein [Testudinibacter sp. TR-2022]